MGKFIIPLGILTYSLALITLLSGLRRVKMQNHQLLAYITIALATLHASLVIYVNYFLGVD